MLPVMHNSNGMLPKVKIFKERFLSEILGCLQIIVLISFGEKNPKFRLSYFCAPSPGPKCILENPFKI